MTVQIFFEDITEKEKEALKQIDKAMKIISNRHWFFAVANGDLCIMRNAEDGSDGMKEDEVNSAYHAASISGHPIDGGDW